MIKHPNRQLDILRLTGDNDQSLALVGRTSRLTTDTDTNRTRLHYLNLTPTGLTNLVDLRTAFPNDAPNEIIGDEDLLRLERPCGRCGGHHVVLVWGGVVCWPWSATPCAFVECAGWTRLAIGETDSAMCFLLLDEDVTDIIGGNMNGVGHPCHA